MKRLSQTLKIGLALFLAVFANGLLPATHAQAYSTTNPGGKYKKVYVCKYVGTPGVDERLQTGGNPISVSKNAIPDFQGIGSYFADQHGRSYVVAWDNGDKVKPPISMCPAPQGTTVVEIPATPSVNDPCGKGNATWVVPADTVEIDWTLKDNGDLVAETKTGYIFSDQKESHNYHKAVETNTDDCQDENETVTPVAPTVTEIEECNQYGSVVINPTTGVTYTFEVGSADMTEGAYKIVATANDGYELAADAQKEWQGSLGAYTECEEPEDDLCLNIDGLQTVVPRNMSRSDDGNCYKKVFVCKYVGKPGVDERLKEGENPISVSVNAIEHGKWDGTIPGWFSDAQDRSYVLGYDDGEFEPTEEDCILKAAPSTVEYLLTACAANTNSTDFLRVRVTNTADDTKNDVEYTVTVKPAIGASISKTVTVADGANSLVEFANLPAGEYVIDISATDETEFESEYVVTIDQCTVTPGSGSGNGHTLGGATDVKTPTVLPTTIPATGANGVQNQLVIVLAALTAYGATFFFQNRRKLSANEA